MRTWAWAANMAIVLSGCFELETVRRPVLDCFEVLGVPRPTFDDGHPESRPQTPQWCRLAPPDDVPPRPTPRAPGACLTLRDGVVWRHYIYDAAGRLIQARERGRRVARWYYDGDTLSGYKDFDGTLYRYDTRGRLIRIEGRWNWTEIQRDDEGRIIGRFSLHGAAGSQTECMARYDPEVGALIEERCVHDDTDSIDTRAVRWDPEQAAWQSRTVRDGVEETSTWRCDANGQPVYDLDAGFDSMGRLVNAHPQLCSTPEDQRLAYDASGALTASLTPCAATTSTVFVDERPICQTYDNSEFWFDGWPPFRPPTSSCLGGCGNYYDIVQPYGPVSMALPEWTDGRLSRLRLDANADGHIDEVIDLPAEYDAAGRLIRETILGRFDVEQVEYRYDCE